MKKAEMIVLCPKARSGFTLIEILIVVIVLGILAMIIVPQISVSTEDAKVSTLKTNLSNMRGAIELYYHQHNNRYPGQYKEADGTTAVTSDAEAATAFIAQMTQYTDANGKISATKTDVFKYGPYLKEGIPANPFKDNSLACDFDQNDITVRTADGTTGWKFHPITGVLFANDHTDHDDF